MLKESNLIFIISQPRAGSTYLQSLLANHPQIATTAEPWFLFPLAAYHQKISNEIYVNHEWFTAAVNEFLEKKGGKSNFYKQLSAFIQQVYFSHTTNACYFLDKTPRYYEILYFIKKLFPEAKIIILKRNPLDVLDSIVNTWKVSTLERLNLFSRDILYAPSFIHQFLTDHKHDNNIYVLKYEELTLQTEKKLKEVFLFLGLDYDTSYLEPNHSKMRGSFGDPKALNRKHERSDHSSFSISDLKKLKEGYAAFLGEKFLSEYGCYRFKRQKETMLFEKFLWMNNFNVSATYRYLFKIGSIFS